MSKSLAKFSILLTMILVLFVQQGLALTKSITSHVEPVAQTKNNNEIRELIPIDAWESVQQGMNTFLQLDSAMTQQFFGGNQRHVIRLLIFLYANNFQPFFSFHD
jgi:hypothetical protein